jgi:5-methylcytosine-specific restriction endonuclease McrA
MPRSVKEWVGRTDDSRPPKSVRLRVFLRDGGRCHISGQIIRVGQEWDLEHVKPLHLAQPGETLNRETNLAPALKQPHREKSAREVSAKAKADRIRLKHTGGWPAPIKRLQSRPFPKSRKEPA